MKRSSSNEIVAYDIVEYEVIYEIVVYEIVYDILYMILFTTGNF